LLKPAGPPFRPASPHPVGGVIRPQNGKMLNDLQKLVGRGNSRPSARPPAWFGASSDFSRASPGGPGPDRRPGGEDIALAPKKKKRSRHRPPRPGAGKVPNHTKQVGNFFSGNPAGGSEFPNGPALPGARLRSLTVAIRGFSGSGWGLAIRFLRLFSRRAGPRARRTKVALLARRPHQAPFLDGR